MCGIIGIKLFSKIVDESAIKTVEKSLQNQQHRGPDASGIFHDDRVVLGHNRLSIIDKKERSNQPMTDATNRFQLIFNGEIYNYPELKNDLLKKGVRFHTSSDTEVLLYFLIEYGTSKIKDLNGCFAFAFYDSQEDELILARDKMGINPLLFALTDEGVYFASELWFFRNLNRFKKINQEALRQFFTYSYIAAPNTILEGVQKLKPGHLLRIKGKYCDLEAYWENKLDKIKLPKTKSAILKETKSRIEDAVIKRLAADVPLGTFLSGGVDSSIVSAIAADFRDNLTTFSVGFSDSPFKDESQYAQEVAQHIGSLHHPIMLSKEKVVKELPSVLDAMDEPFGDSSAVAMYFLAKETKKSLTVALSGDGADELFGGYNKHTAYLKSQHLGVLKKTALGWFAQLGKGNRGSKKGELLRKINKFNTLANLPSREKYSFLAQFVEEPTVHALLKSHSSSNGLNLSLADQSLNTFLLRDQDFVLQGDMLKKVDLMSMRHSLEVRTPFLDEHVVDWANSLPQELKNDGKNSKIILKEAFKDLLPASIFERKKQGFEIPLKGWILASWSEITQENWFNEDYLVEQDIFNAKFVKEMKRQFMSGDPKDWATLIWLYIVFQHWYAKWINEK